MSWSETFRVQFKLHYRNKPHSVPPLAKDGGMLDVGPVKKTYWYPQGAWQQGQIVSSLWKSSVQTLAMSMFLSKLFHIWRILTKFVNVENIWFCCQPPTTGSHASTLRESNSRPSDRDRASYDCPGTFSEWSKRQYHMTRQPTTNRSKAASCRRGI